MTFILFVTLYFSTFLIGYLCSILLRVKEQAERIGVSFLLGTLWLTIVSLILNVYGNYAYTPKLVGITVLFGLSIGIVGVGIKKLPEILISLSNFRHIKLSFFEKVLIGILVFLVFSSVFQNYFWPITDWDSLALYDFRARVLVIDGSMEKGEELGYFFQYPPYTSLLHATSYVFGIQEAKIWYSVIYASFIITFFALLRKSVPQIVALVGAILLAISPAIFEHATVAYTNLAYTTFFVLGSIYLWYWWDTGKLYQALLGGIFFAASIWVRQTEPFWILGVILLLTGWWKYKKQWLVVVLGLLWIHWMKNFWTATVHVITAPVTSAPITAAPSIPPQQQSFLIETLAKIFATAGAPIAASELARYSLIDVGQNIVKVTSYLVAYVFPLFSYLLIPVGVIFFLEWQQKLLGWRILALLSVIVLLGIIYLGTLVFSFSFVTWDLIGGSAQRMSMFLPPLLIFICMSSPVWKKLKIEV